ncbi:translation elongation factor [Xanthomonas phage MET23-P3]|nr:translation elongation factor [Xanthomonas phage MET23-P3]
MNPNHTPIETLMEELDGGTLGARIAAALAEAAVGVAACNDKRKKGKVTVEFAITPVGGDQSQVQIDHTVKFATPTQRGKKLEEIATSSVMYVSNRGALTVLPNTNKDLFKPEEGVTGANVAAIR